LHSPNHRLFDAASNRAAEGLRVLEDLARFTLNAPNEAQRAKSIRHAIRDRHATAWVAARDTAGDQGRTASGKNPAPRSHLPDLIRANANRASEALRTLAELHGVAQDAEAAAQCELDRFQVYDLEKSLLVLAHPADLTNKKLYVLLDTQTCTDPLNVCEATCQNGADIVQLRGKNLSIAEYWHLAQQTQEICQRHEVLFIVNDHIDIAAAIHADGVHLGQHDAPVELARHVLGDVSLIGLSCHHPDEVQAAQTTSANYLGLGPMYATATKSHEPARGPELLATSKPVLTLPSYAIGGISLERAKHLLPSLPHGLAIASAIGNADEPGVATAAFAELFRGA
jgi:thiamine-phosphate pyrophosphorylase